MRLFCAINSKLLMDLKKQTTIFHCLSDAVYVLRKSACHKQPHGQKFINLFQRVSRMDGSRAEFFIVYPHAIWFVPRHSQSTCHNLDTGCEHAVSYVAQTGTYSWSLMPIMSSLSRDSVEI